MSLAALLIAIIVIGFALWAVNSFIPMQPPFKTIFNVVIVLAAIIWLLNMAGLLNYKI